MSGGPGSAPLAPDPILPPTRALVFSRLPRSPPHLPRVPIPGPSQQRSVQRWARALRGGAAGEVGPGAEALQPVCVPQSGAAPADLLACMFMRVCVRACACVCVHAGHRVWGSRALIKLLRDWANLLEREQGIFFPIKYSVMTVLLSAPSGHEGKQDCTRGQNRD